MKLKRILCMVLTLFLLGNLPLLCSANAIEAPKAETEAMPFSVEAKAVVLGDVASGKVLTGKNMHEKVYPASVTKIMTLLLTMEALETGKIKLQDVVTASKTAASKGGSQIWLKEGEKMTVHELLKATAVASANDASTALGEYIAGSEGAFVHAMNEKAKALGMQDTHFENCTGLDDHAPQHKTSAYDVFLMSRALLMYPKIFDYTHIWMDSLRNGKTSLVNTNKLLRSYKDITGLKTGTTSKAGCCVSASAKRDNTHLVAVVLGSPNSKDRFKTAERMLDWGFATYETVTLSVEPSALAPVLIRKGEKTEVMPVLPKPTTVLLKRGEKENIKQEIKLALDVEAPVEKGQRLGNVVFLLQERPIATVDLLTSEEIMKLSFLEAFRRILCVLCG